MYTSNNIFHTSFKNLNRNLYVNLKILNFMLTTMVRTWHCYKMKAQILKKNYAEHTSVSVFWFMDKNSNKANNHFIGICD